MGIPILVFAYVLLGGPIISLSLSALCLSLLLYIYIYMCIYVCTYIYIYTHTLNSSEDGLSILEYISRDVYLEPQTLNTKPNSPFPHMVIYLTTIFRFARPPVVPINHRPEAQTTLNQPELSNIILSPGQA